MVTKRIIPCLDIRNGRVVKGVNFKGVQDVEDPVALARRYNDAGADELVFYDITASVEGRGLFTDILNILSLSELGVGTAITYALYVPIAKGDIKKQQILMRMFRTFYRMTALFVMAAGLCLIPFLDILMKEKDVDKHNQIVLAMIRRAAAENDVVVLAQGSMITLLPYLNEMPAPVLTSPRLGIERAWAMLQEKG